MRWVGWLSLFLSDLCTHSYSLSPFFVFVFFIIIFIDLLCRSIYQ